MVCIDKQCKHGEGSPGCGDVVCGDDLTSSGQRHRPCPTFAFFNEEAIGGLVQGDAAGDSFRASAGSCASANRWNRTSAAAISCLLQGHGLEQGDAAGDGFRASAGSCASANQFIAFIAFIAVYCSPHEPS